MVAKAKDSPIKTDVQNVAEKLVSLLTVIDCYLSFVVAVWELNGQISIL